MSHATTNCDWKMSQTKMILSNCDCKVSQLIRELFSTLIKGGNVDCDCKSHPCMGKKRRGGAGARQRRSVRRAGASLPPLPPIPQSHRRHSPEPPALPPRRSSTSLATPWPRPLPRPPPSPPPRPPQRSSSLKSSTQNAVDRKKIWMENLN